MSSTNSLPNATKTSVQVISSTSSQQIKKQKLDSNPDITAKASQPTISGDISQTLSLFECCVCLEYINPPILQCRNSHVFCQTCRQKFRSPLKCPTCRVELLKTDIRSHLLEQIAESLGLQFACKYSSNGCDVTSLLTELPKHQTECEFVPYRCLHVFKDCQWLGSREEVAQHLIDKHKFDVRESSYLYLQNKLDDEMIRCRSRVLQYKNQNFICIMLFDSERKHFKAFVLFIGEQRIADQFKYKIEIINQSNGKQLHWIDKPISIRKNDILLLRFSNTDDGLNLEENMIKRLSYDNSFDFKLTIQSETNE